jgi:hypothetical protein
LPSDKKIQVLEKQTDASLPTFVASTSTFTPSASTSTIHLRAEARFHSSIQAIAIEGDRLSYDRVCMALTHLSRLAAADESGCLALFELTQDLQLKLLYLNTFVTIADILFVEVPVVTTVTVPVQPKPQENSESTTPPADAPPPLPSSPPPSTPPPTSLTPEQLQQIQLTETITTITKEKKLLIGLLDGASVVSLRYA